jgi:hypothetical protein
MTFTHTLDIDTTTGRATRVQVVFEADRPAGTRYARIHGILSLQSTPEPLDDEDIFNLGEWLIQDKEEWI